MPEQTPVVPDRNDAPSIDIYARSKAHEVAGLDDSFAYEYFSRDPKHPSFVGKKLRAHEIGDPASGYCMVDAWEVVDSKDVQQGAKRADDTKGIDTTVTHGDDILCRTPKANHAAYGAIQDKRQEFIDAQFRGESKTLASGSRVRNVVSTGFAEDGADRRSVHDLLNQR